ncbi:MAG: HEAT repeat domain-containing protein [Planctomycetes bacterium]|nr:HEAT repeat domain-containing protein [Planctomycetota bacterium]
MSRTAALLLWLGIVAVGCSKEEVYEGKTTRDWIQALQAESPAERSAAATALGQIAPSRAVVPALIVALEDEQSNVRAAAAESLGKLGQNAKSAVPPLTRTQVRDQSDAVRRAAAQALTQIQARQPDSSSQPRLPFFIGIATLAILSGLSGVLLYRWAFGPARVPTFVNRLKHAAPEIRRGAAQALARCGQAARAAVPPLVAALNDPTESVRHDAEQALARILLGGQPSVAVFIEALRYHKDPFVRSSAAAILAALGRTPKAVVPALIGSLADPAEDVRIACIKALVKMGPEAAPAIPHLQRAKEDPDYAVRQEAFRALPMIRARSTGHEREHNHPSGSR